MLRDLIVSIADGGDCLADLNVLRGQPELFGEVASSPTAWRVIESITREARRRARERAWRTERHRSGSRWTSTPRWSPPTPRRRRGAAGNFKGGFGFHPLLCYLDESNEALAGILP